MKKPSDFYCCICGQPLNDRQDLFVKIRDNDSEETLRIVPVHSGNWNDKELEKYLVTGEV